MPAFSLEQALKVPRALGDNYAFQPTRPLDLAAGLAMSPSSSGFRMLCGASIAYGLTEGGYNAPVITTTALARRILEPKDEGEDDIARQEAALRPRVLREFLGRYDGARFPREDIAMNVLAQMGVPREATKRTLEHILGTARTVGFLREIKGNAYVNLAGNKEGITVGGTSTSDFQYVTPREKDDAPSPIASPPTYQSGAENRRVFLTHGKNRSFLDPLKDLLSFGELEPVVSVERESVSQPVPDKVMSEMRSCGAAVIHVDEDQRLLDQNGDVQISLNANVLIEIGAAMALYGRRFIRLYWR